MSLPRLSRSDVRFRKLCESEIAGFLGRLLGAPISVRLTRNRRCLISFDRDPRGQQSLRAHVSLAGAENHELAIVASWIQSVPGTHAAVRTLITNLRERWSGRDPAPAEREADGSAGHHHDLNRILGELTASYFPGLAPVLISWTGRLGPSRRRRLGAWDPRTRMIGVHRALDRPEVPPYFLEHVIHHELCHAASDPPLTPTGKHRWHGPEFRLLESSFPDLERALDWERRNVGLLLR